MSSPAGTLQELPGLDSSLACSVLSKIIYPRQLLLSQNHPNYLITDLPDWKPTELGNVLKTYPVPSTMIYTEVAV